MSFNSFLAVRWASGATSELRAATSARTISPAAISCKTDPCYRSQGLAARSGPHTAFELAFAEGNRFLDRFTLLRALRDHLAHGSL
jgi:hypothetical protein